MISLSKCLWLMFVIVGVRAGGRDIEGNDDGTNGNDGLNGTVGVPKIILGSECFRANASTDAVTLVLYVNQEDVTFGYSNISAAYASELIQYELCYPLDYVAFANGTAVRATDCEGVSSANFTLVADNGLGESFGQRSQNLSFSADFSIPGFGGSGPCGGNYSDSKLYLAMYCKQDLRFDKDFDIAFMITYDVNSSLCWSETIDSVPLIVGQTPVVEVDREYSVYMNVFKADSLIEDIVGPNAQAASKTPVSIVNLNELIFLEACISLPGALYSDNKFFQLDGFSVVGIRMETCTAYPVAYESTAVNPDDFSLFVDEDGCATGADPVQIAAGDFAFKYVANDTNDILTSYRYSPNCFRTDPFPSVSFIRRRLFDTIGVMYECYVKFCTTFNDADGVKCFGANIEGEDYSSVCPIGKKKRKRDVQSDEDDLPNKVSATVFFDHSINAREEKQTKVANSGCFEKTTYIGLSSGLGVLLLVVLMICSYFAMRLLSSKDEDISRTTDSMTGFKNKAYF